MAGDKELGAGLKAMAEDFRLPGGGRKKLSRLVAGHLGWFDAAERRGMGWQDMIGALTAAGVTGRGGRPLSVGTLSSTVWRKRAEAKNGIDRAGGDIRLASPEPAATQLRPPKKTKRRSAGQPPRSKGAPFRPIDDQVQQASRQAPTPSKRSAGSAREVRSQSKEVLAFMDRARAVRRQSDW